MKLSKTDYTIFNQIARNYYGGYASQLKPGHPVVYKLLELGWIIVKGSTPIATHVTLSKKGKIEFITGVHSRAYRDLGDTSDDTISDGGGNPAADTTK